MAADDAATGGSTIMRSLLTQFLMLGILAAFSMGGAHIFMNVEGPHETSVKHDLVEMRTDVINALWNSSHRLSTNKKGFSKFAKEHLKLYEAQLYSAFGAGINSDSDEKVWDVWGSLVYCTTIYTTIGYGHIFPVTKGGRVMTMIYAIVGIPLCLIVLTEMGKFMTLLIKYVLAVLKKLSASKNQSASYAVNDQFDLSPITALIIAGLYIFGGAALYTQWEEDWDYFDACYFIFISISTIGFGDVLPSDEKYFIASYVYQLFGLALVAMVINVVMEAEQKHIDQAKDQLHKTLTAAPSEKKTQ